MTNNKTATKERIDILVLGVKEEFQEWIKSRGGVKVWQNVNLSNPDAGDHFTPALTQEGQDFSKPHWSVAYKETVNDISRFRFAKEKKEVKRVKISLDKRLHGFTIQLTSSSSNKFREACRKIKKQYGFAPMYHFEELEAVIEIPIFED
jgi:hypothetical protein